MVDRHDSTFAEPAFEDLASEAEAAAVPLVEVAAASADMAEQVQDFHDTSTAAEQDVTRGESPKAARPNSGATIIDFAAEAERLHTEHTIEAAASTPAGPMRFSAKIYSFLEVDRVA